MPDDQVPGNRTSVTRYDVAARRRTSPAYFPPCESDQTVGFGGRGSGRTTAAWLALREPRRDFLGDADALVALD